MAVGTARLYSQPEYGDQIIGLSTTGVAGPKSRTVTSQPDWCNGPAHPRKPHPGPCRKCSKPSNSILMACAKRFVASPYSTFCKGLSLFTASFKGIKPLGCRVVHGGNTEPTWEGAMAMETMTRVNEQMDVAAKEPMAVQPGVARMRELTPAQRRAVIFAQRQVLKAPGRQEGQGSASNRS